MRDKTGPLSAVVIGSDHINTLGIIRSLGIAGIKPTLILVKNCNTNSWVSKSKYIDECFILENQDSIILDKLIEIRNHRRGELYLYPAGDRYTSFIDSNYYALSQYYIVPNCMKKQGAIAEFTSKARMQEIAQHAGFSHIKTLQLTFTGDKQDIERVKNYFGDTFPLLIRSDQSGIPGCQYTILSSSEDLEQLNKQHQKGTAIIQQYIEKDEEIGVQGVAWDGECYVGSVIHKKRTSIESYGSTTYAELQANNDTLIASLIKEFIKETDYSGIFDIEIIRKGKEIYFIECNFRNGAYGYAYTVYGENLPLIWMTKKVPVQDSKTRSIRLMNEFSDIKHVRNREITLLAWMCDFITSKVHMTVNIWDMKPFIYRAFWKIK